MGPNGCYKMCVLKMEKYTKQTETILVHMVPYNHTVPTLVPSRPCDIWDHVQCHYHMRGIRGPYETIFSLITLILT